MSASAKARDEWARWIHSQRPWGCFATLTFRPSRVGAITHPEVAQKAIRKDILEAGFADTYFWVIGRHKSGSALAHGLMKSAKTVRAWTPQECLALKEYWYRQRGIARVYPVWGDGRDVSAFLSKHVVMERNRIKEANDDGLFIGGHWRPTGVDPV